MLQYLQIKNLALLDELSLEFLPGFTVVTGETGAGKSILLGALALLSGARVDKSVIKQNTETCLIEGSIYFNNCSRINAILEELNLPICEENTLILHRSLSLNKSPRIQINGALSTLSSLQVLGSYWIDFHGPGEPQKLFQNNYQLEMLDLYAGVSATLKKYLESYRAWQTTLKESENLAKQDRLSLEEISFYQSQIDKINSLNPSQKCIEELESNFNKVSRAQEISDLTMQVCEGLSSDEGVSVKLQQLYKILQHLCEIDSSFTNFETRVNSIIIEFEDLAQEFMRAAEAPDFDAESVHEIQNSMTLWLEIQRKYGPTLETILQKRDALVHKINSQSNIEETLQALHKKAEEEEKALRAVADKITQDRRKAANELAKKVKSLLKNLGFQKAEFEIRIVEERELKNTGNSTADFLFAPNVGQVLMPLNKIASSGETARVMLALKAILAQVDQTPLLVFDEVDANVGGEIGAHVAAELAKLAQEHQVFCVTHLPQVAAQAHNHYLVEKTQTSKKTAISIKKIDDPEERINEVARMLGNRNAVSARNHAETLLQSSPIPILAPNS